MFGRFLQASSRSGPRLSQAGHVAVGAPRGLTTWMRFQRRSLSTSTRFQQRQSSRAFTGLPLLTGIAAATLLAATCTSEETACEYGSETSFAHQPRFQNMKIFAGPANMELAADVANGLGIELGAMKVKQFADGEVSIRVNENVRGKDCYIIQPTCPPDVNDHIMQLLLMISTLRRASAGSITAVMPYYGYARQDRKMQSRVPISAADMARLLESMGVDRVVSVDMHCGQIQGFFSPTVPVDNLEGHVVGLTFFQDQGLSQSNTVVVSPDAGGVYRAKQFREGLKMHGMDAGLAMIIKQRSQDTTIQSMDLVGDVVGKDVIMVDDMIDTAGTLTKAAQELKDMGAKRVFAFATHGLFSGPAYSRIANSCLEKVVVTNSIPLQPGAPDNIVQLSIANLLSESIARIHLKKSVSALFYHQKE